MKHNDAIKPKGPMVLHLRDTKLHDEGNGRRIWTTAGSGYERIPYMQLTDAIRDRLSATGGVERKDVVQAVTSLLTTTKVYEETVNEIMQLIAAGAVEVKE